MAQLGSDVALAGQRSEETKGSSAQRASFVSCTAHIFPRVSNVGSTVSSTRPGMGEKRLWRQ